VSGSKKKVERIFTYIRNNRKVKSFAHRLAGLYGCFPSLFLFFSDFDKFLQQ